MTRTREENALDLEHEEDHLHARERVMRACIQRELASGDAASLVQSLLRYGRDGLNDMDDMDLVAHAVSMGTVAGDDDDLIEAIGAWAVSRTPFLPPSSRARDDGSSSPTD